MKKFMYKTLARLEDIILHLTPVSPRWAWEIGMWLSDQVFFARKPFRR